MPDQDFPDWVYGDPDAVAPSQEPIFDDESLSDQRVLDALWKVAHNPDVSRDSQDRAAAELNRAAHQGVNIYKGRLT